MNSTVTDPGSLANLNDIILPPAIPWWPPAPGWYFVFAAVALSMLWVGWRTWRRWRANAYRREALAAWDAIPASGSDYRIESILKRVALQTYPRATVASLSGNDWRAFLVRTGGEGFSDDIAWSAFQKLCYGAGLEEIEAESRLRVFEAGRSWIQKHDPDAR